ncbi:MAG: HepT-like ribonuclease domain-containing protein [Gemmataceae bacterium]
MNCFRTGLRHLQMIGEATRALSQSFRGARPTWPWSQIVGMRNILVHHYFDVDTDIVWGVVEKDLPSFKVIIEDAIRALEAPKT